MKKIVIIEDDKILREELEILLNDSGYQAEILSDFTDAAAQVRQIRPDLVLLDIILPGANQENFPNADLLFTARFNGL